MTARKSTIDVPPGAAVDSHGRAVIDPTANVLALVEAAVSRLNDLRAVDVESTHELRAADNHRNDELRVAESRRLTEIAALHALYGEKLSIGESKRIDAIRAVDVAAVATAADRSAQQAQVLATQVAASAETLRGLVATTAATVATQLSTIATQLTERIAALEKAQYESKGISTGSPLMDRISALESAKHEGAGSSKGMRDLWGFVVGATVALIAIAGLVFNVRHK